MVEYGACLRAIPNRARSVLEASHADEYPTGRIVFLPEFKREMLVIESVPERTGQFLVVKTGIGTLAKVDFGGEEDFYESLNALNVDYVKDQSPEDAQVSVESLIQRLVDARFTVIQDQSPDGDPAWRIESTSDEQLLSARASFFKKRSEAQGGYGKADFGAVCGGIA